MKLLYIHKQERGPYWKRTTKELRDAYLLQHRVGFFRASLKTRADVYHKGIEYLEKTAKRDIDEYDAVIFNYECKFREPGDPLETFGNAVRKLESRLKDIPRILLLSSPNAEKMPDDDMMDLFQLVFRREHYKDLERYKLSPRNRDKIRTTALSCPLVPSNILNFKTLKPEEYGHENPPNGFEQDLFFLGQETTKSRSRSEIVRFLKQSEFNFLGGLHQDIRNPENTVDEALRFPRMSSKKFYETSRRSRINLALDGYGQFTYRHWECWALAVFMLSSSSVNEVQLPFEMVDGEHYATFENMDDLLEKTRFYLDHREERNRIAANGRKLFEQEYDFFRHGTYIREAIENIL